MKQTTAKMSELFEIDTSLDPQTSVLKLTEVPMPPSANEMYNMTTGLKRGKHLSRWRSKVYDKWLRDTGWLLSLRARTLVEKTPFTINLRVHLNRRSDIDNRVKPMLDLLKNVGIVHDDRYCDRLCIERDMSIKADTMSVEIRGEWIRP